MIIKKNVLIGFCMDDMEDFRENLKILFFNIFLYVELGLF